MLSVGRGNSQASVKRIDIVGFSRVQFSARRFASERVGGEVLFFPWVSCSESLVRDWSWHPRPAFSYPFFSLLSDSVGCCFNENQVMKLAWQEGSLARRTCIPYDVLFFRFIYRLDNPFIS
jgi:hypothetical protein